MLELNFSQTLGTHCLTLNETLPASGITAIFGVSGAGKTSLINAISGLTQPQSGRIVLNGRVLNDVENGICLTPEKTPGGLCFPGCAPVPAL
ncbi:Molybdenum transport ATP-binding protein ModC (TC 3.A.1.8.1) [Citrobacter freundii]|uniref:Molybdenum transport ATP-binding protein ModC (TC 3.A.1.8.1) n=1 Tax=Citrobacter freundii TaxID=546 RepID=A0A7G2IHE8_CITFR|nr:Molybdenum transport ATP-binding protein ModC (TC 3.A.1.8.1) [Citrobacter freundii]